MKFSTLKRLQHRNRQLKNEAWKTYQVFLGKLLTSTNHPLAGRLNELLAQEKFSEMVDLADYASSAVYTTAAEHRLCNQLAAVIRKYPFPMGRLNFDPERKAREKFLASEQKCKRVNQRFTLFMNLRSPEEKALRSASDYIGYTLGEIDYQEILGNCNFGDGASIGVAGNATNNARKLLSKSWSVTPGAYDYAKAALKMDIHAFEALVGSQGQNAVHFSVDPDLFNRKFGEKARLIDNNNITFVPKTVKTLRTIAVEPLMNGYLQKGIDIFMRKRLKRIGINLEDQSINQKLAKCGSMKDQTDPYVTIDLSSASDSISRELCRYMLPPDWFDLLNRVRCHSYKLDGVVRPFHKFVTMGNGFCFPLETLIFASLCKVAYTEFRLPEDFIVYGDDIIVRQSVAARVLKLLSVCGFTVNRDKTFLTGPFRESCGADWFEGEDVRPLNLDYEFDSIENIFKFCNLSRSKDSWKAIFGEACDYLVSLVPPDLMFTRPYKGNVDTALEVDLDAFLTSKFSRWNRNTQSWEWIEIGKTAVPDNAVRKLQGYESILMRGACTGAQSSLPFAERYTARTKIRRVSYQGASSTLLPDWPTSWWRPYWVQDRRLSGERVEHVR